MGDWPPPSGIEIEANWRLDTTHFETWRAFRKWLIDGEAKVERTRGSRDCVWPHAWVQVLGLSLGAGLYVDRGSNIGMEQANG